MSFVSEKIKTIPFSGIRKFFDVANEMDGAISLGVGEPDFDTPWNIREEAIYRLEQGNTIYTSNAGLMELRRAIADYMRERFACEYSPASQILAVTGVSEALDLTMRAILNPGDEVILAEPCFSAYKSCILMAGGVPVVADTKAENDFRLLPEDFSQLITKKTKALLIGYPNNPTGAVMERADLEKIADVLRDKEILMISDEIYAELTYGAAPVSIASLPGMQDKTIVLNGFSKTFSMTGWRLGYACGPEEIISAMLKIHQYTMMCAPTVSQYAGIEALRGGWDSVGRMRKEYDARRRVMVNGFRAMGMDCFEPRGAFYVFPSIQKTKLSSDEFCTQLLYDQKLAVVPGSAFGGCGEGFIRCCYAYSIEDIKEALRRVLKFMEKF